MFSLTGLTLIGRGCGRGRSRHRERRRAMQVFSTGAAIDGTGRRHCPRRGGVGAAAQGVTGTITGTVKDAQGGVIPGATVTLISDTRGTHAGAGRSPAPPATSSFPNITADTYTVQVEMPSFRTLRRDRRRGQLGIDRRARHASRSTSAARPKSSPSSPKRRSCRRRAASDRSRSPPSRSPTCRSPAAPSKRCCRWRRASS